MERAGGAGGMVSSWAQPRGGSGSGSHGDCIFHHRRAAHFPNIHTSLLTECLRQMSPRVGEASAGGCVCSDHQEREDGKQSGESRGCELLWDRKRLRAEGRREQGRAEQSALQGHKQELSFASLPHPPVSEESSKPSGASFAGLIVPALSH